MSLANKMIPIAIVYLSDDREPPVSATIFGGTIVAHTALVAEQ